MGGKIGMTMVELATQFIRWLYEATEGDTATIMEANTFLDLPSAAGTTERQLSNAIKHLENRNLVKAAWSLGGLPGVWLTTRGIEAVEEAARRPEQATADLAPWSTTIYVTHVGGSIIGSQFAVASPNAVQTGTFDYSANDIHEFIEAARLIADSVALTGAARDDFDIDVTTMDKEIRRENPRHDRLRSLGKSIKAVLENAAGSMIAMAAMPELVHAWSVINSINF
jgi:hypothetical protein